MIKINNIFSIGYRCTNDELLKSMKLREYSGPFSYMVIDYKSALEFIENRFQKYLDFDYLNNTKYYWCENLWIKNLFFNKKYTPNSKSNIRLDKWNKICVWPHHNLFNDTPMLKRRCNRFLNILDNKPSTMLLLCIPKIQEYSTDTCFYDLDLLLNFIGKHKTHLLMLVPLHNFNHLPLVVYNKDNLLIVYFNSYYEKNGTAYSDNRIRWDMIKKIINDNYVFDIDKK
jgi:hypothetical protein